MKSTGRYSEHEELEMAPEKPFLEDIYKDLVRIDDYYNKETAAGVTPEIRAAIPIVSGCTAVSFCCTSVDKPFTLL